MHVHNLYYVYVVQIISHKLHTKKCNTVVFALGKCCLEDVERKALPCLQTYMQDVLIPSHLYFINLVPRFLLNDNERLYFNPVALYLFLIGGGGCRGSDL